MKIIELTEAEYDSLWDTIARARDAAPRTTDDADTSDIIDEICDSGWLYAFLLERLARVQVEQHVAQAVTEHVEYMRGYTLFGGDSSWLDGYKHALDLVARDATFIAARGVSLANDPKENEA